MAHTPLPWNAHWSKYQDGVYIVQAGMPSMRVLARFDGDGDGADAQSIADADLIVRAVNAHDDLVAALQNLCAAYVGCNGEDHPAYAVARAILRKAGA